MDNNRMDTADMLQYCNEALAWEEFGPVDVFFFESVKKILLGQCTPFDEPDEDDDDLMGIERPVTDDELAPDYDKYADEYYTEDGEESSQPEQENEKDVNAFSDRMFSTGFFNEDESSGSADSGSTSFTVNV